MAFENPIQIAKTNARTKVFEINDKMSFNKFDTDLSGVIKSTVHSKYSKIEVVIVDYTKGKKDKTVVPKHNIDVDQVKTMANSVLNSNYDDIKANYLNETFKKERYKLDKGKEDYDRAVQQEYQRLLKINDGKNPEAKLIDAKLGELEKVKQNKFAHPRLVEFCVASTDEEKFNVFKKIKSDVLVNVEVNGFIHSILVEEKILPNKKGDTNPYNRVTKFKLEYHSKMNNPWKVTIENGKAMPQEQQTGGTSIKSGTYKSESVAFTVVTDWDMKKLMLTTSDYIRAFEEKGLAGMLQYRTAYEKKMKDEADAQKRLAEQNTQNTQK